MTVTDEALDAATADAAAGLDDDDFERLVLDNVGPHDRDRKVWAALTTPQNLRRTHTVLVQAVQRNASAMAARRRDLCQREMAVRGAATGGVVAKAREAKQEYELWRQRAIGFSTLIQTAITEVNSIRREREIEADRVRAARYREQLRTLAVAIGEHQRRTQGGAIAAEDHDRELWRTLEDITVPHGPGSPLLTLATMIENHWK